MALVKRKYLMKEKTRHGAIIWYFRRDKATPRIRLPNNPESPEFDAAYWAAYRGEKPKKIKLPRDYDTYSVGWLVAKYQASGVWLRQKLSTRKARARILDKFVQEHGKSPITILNKANIKAGLEKRANKSANANEWLQVMRNMLTWAVDDGIVANNPAKDVKFIKHEGEGFTAWTMQDVTKFRKKYEIGTMPRLALEMLLYTGLRRSDLVKLSPAHLKDGLFTIRPMKTPKIVVTFPLHQDLKRIIDATIKTDDETITALSYIKTTYGKSFSPEGFTNTFRKWAKSAGLEDFSPHGGRKLAATLLAEAGASEIQLMAAFGWTKSEMAQLYTKSANRAKMGVEAWQKMGTN